MPLFYEKPPKSSEEVSKTLPDTDVLIVGAGPIGATLARQFINAGLKVVMVDQGSADSFTLVEDNQKQEIRVPGSHKKNTMDFQKEVDRFAYVIKSALSTVSVPVEELDTNKLNPQVWAADGTKPASSNGKNPNQKVNVNLPGQGVTRCVGGMSTHWGCATPRLHPTLELPILMSDTQANITEWGRLYTIAEALIGTTSDVFDKSVRQNLVIKYLQKAYNSEGVPLPKWPKVTKKGDKRAFGPLPVACHRWPGKDYVFWHAADTILQDIFKDSEKRGRLTILTNTGCKYLEIGDPDSSGSRNVTKARCVDYLKDATGGAATVELEAKFFVVAAGAVATPQILFNSDKVYQRNTQTKVAGDSVFPQLGKYITEQPMSFCQVILDKDIINSIASTNSNSLPIPLGDSGPQVLCPVSEVTKWEVQISRGVFPFSAVEVAVDERTIIDLYFFGIAQPQSSNTITFEETYFDAFGMPQPTFNFRLSDDDRHRANAMMKDMCAVSGNLGGYLPGSEPQFMPPGSALHLAGTTRAGLDSATHVADTSCKVFNFGNLYVAGNGVIPTGFAANPTLTSMCYALRTAENIIKNISDQKAKKEGGGSNGGGSGGGGSSDGGGSGGGGSSGGGSTDDNTKCTCFGGTRFCACPDSDCGFDCQCLRYCNCRVSSRHGKGI